MIRTRRQAALHSHATPSSTFHDVEEEEQEEDEDDIVEEEEEEEEDDLEGKDDRDPRHRLRPPPLKRKRNHLRSSPSPVDLDLDLDLDLTSRRVIPLTSSSSSSLRSPTSTSTSPQPTHHNVYTLPKPFKHPHFQGVKRKIRSLKQITSALASVPITDFPTWLSIQASPSVRPVPKFCDLTGLPAPYTDPATGLFFYNAEIYQHMKKWSTSQVQTFLALRNKAVVI